MIAYLDCSTGVSGDKLLGALVDAGFEPEVLAGALRAMGLQRVRASAKRLVSGGVTGTGVQVTEDGAPARHWPELHEMLETAPLPEQVRDGAQHALGILAGAEAEVHGIEPEDVRFHELGAADTIADILGVSLALHQLGVRDLVVSPVAVGSGVVATAHGDLPVPAPATALLLRGMPVVPGSARGELTTPTGAALLATFATGFGAVPPMTLRRVGIGCGTRETGVPNVCMLLLGDSESAQPGRDDVVLLETNIDHLTPEELATAAERMRQAGALDVWQTPIVMKKGRAAVLVSALVPAAEASGLAERMMAETGTLGVRLLPAERRVAERDVAEIETSLGTARFKVAVLPGAGRVLRVESDDAARIAASTDRPVAEVAAALEDEAARMTGVPPMRQR